MAKLDKEQAAQFEAIVRRVVPEVVREVVPEAVRPIIREVVREEVRAEVASQLEIRLPAHLAPIQADTRAIREAYVEDVTVIAGDQIAIKRSLRSYDRRLTALESVVKM